jgi:DNA repair exonuclease SbcCD ATPase subunit
MFEYIKATNLFSWENLSFHIESGITQITGFNYDDATSEGSGKSSIPNILAWTLYGKVPKDAKIDEVIREGSNSGKGEVKLSTGEIIARARKPNDLYIVDQDGVVIRGKDAKETQNLVNALIKLDFEAFCQSVYFAQNYPKKFITANEQDKATILSDIQDLSVFDRARKKTQDLIKEKELILVGTLSKRSNLLTQIKGQEDLINHVSDVIDSFEREQGETLESLSLKYMETEVKVHRKASDLLDSDKINLKISKVEASIEELVNLKQTLLSDIQADTLLQNKISNLREKLSAYHDGQDHCPLCKSELTKEKQEVVEAERSSLNSELEVLLSQKKELVDPEYLKEVDAGLKSLVSEVQQLRELANGVRFQELEIKHLADMLDSISSQIALEESKTPKYTQDYLLTKIEELSESEERLKTSDSSIFVLQKEIIQLNALKDGFKDVKSHIFRGLLEELSRKSTEFTQELYELPIKIRFYNEDLEGSISKIQTEVTLDGSVRPIGLFSGGQGRRIEIGTSLALAALISGRSTRSMDFRVLDEPMKDLSESSQEKVVELLRKLPGSTIIIEHSPVTKAIISNTFNIEYRNGISKSVTTKLEMP